MAVVSCPLLSATPSRTSRRGLPARGLLATILYIPSAHSLPRCHGPEACHSDRLAHPRRPSRAHGRAFPSPPSLVAPTRRRATTTRRPGGGPSTRCARLLSRS